jgi:replicative DNA helicase
MQLEHSPPFDLQAEIGVIGSCFVMPPQLAKSLLPELLGKLEPADFYDEGHGVQWAAIRSLAANRKPVDPTLFLDAIKSAGKYEFVGGSAYISKVINAVPNAAHAVHYADIVLEKSYARRVITELTTVLVKAYDETVPAAELSSALESSIGRLESRGASVDLPIAIGESIQRLITDLRKPPEVRAASRAHFGIRKVDEIVGAVHAGESCVIAARPGMGKSTFVASPLRYAAAAGRPSLLISLEMGQKELAGREVSRGTSIDNHFIRNGDLDDADFAEIERFQRSVEGQPFYTWDPSSATFAQIRAVALHAKNKLGITVLGIDYIGLVSEPPKFKGQRRDHLAEVSRGLKKLAKEMSIPVFVLCQLNREKERPNLSMLAECGAIEQDADSVIFLHADASDDPYREVIVAKFRGGQTGSFKLGWQGKKFDFTDYQNDEFA